MTLLVHASTVVFRPRDTIRILVRSGDDIEPHQAQTVADPIHVGGVMTNAKLVWNIVVLLRVAGVLCLMMAMAYAQSGQHLQVANIVADPPPPTG